MVVEFNEDQKELLKIYRELLTYGYEKISKVPLNLSKSRVRKKILYFMMGAMQSYSESILKLMGSLPVYEKPGESLLRSQLELWLNMRFIYSSRTEDKARLFLSDLIIDSNTYAKRHKSLWNKYPKWNLVFGKIKNAAEWDKFISDNNKILEKNQNKHHDKKVNKLPNLYDKTLVIDKYLKKIGKLSEKTSAEKFYILFYPYFSQAVHLSMPGLQRFIKNNNLEDKKTSFQIDSKPEEAERVLIISFIAYFATLHLFLQVFNMYDKNEYDKFKKFSKNISKGKTISK